MTLIRFTYDDGDNSATVTWSPEYGFAAAGTRSLLDRITVQEVEPRLNGQLAPRETQVADLPPDAPVVAGEDEDLAQPPARDRCFSCGCSAAAHLEQIGDDEGQLGCAKHQCRQFVA